MVIFAWIIVGLIAGFLAKLVMPGDENEPGGFIGTMILGIVGAVIGGWVWSLLLGQEVATRVNLGSIFVAFIGSMIVIALLRAFSRNRTVV